MGINLKKIGKNIVNTYKKAGKDVGKTAVKATKDTFHEVKRHPGTYAALAAGIATGGLSLGATAGLKTVGTSLAKKVIVDKVKDAVIPKKADGSVDVGGTVRNIVGVGTAVEGYRAGKKADKLTDESLHYARENYDANAGLRASSRAALEAGPKHTDLSHLYDAQATNPYRRRRRLPEVGSSR